MKFLYILFFFLYINAQSQNLLYNENFDDQDLDQPSVGTATIYYDFSWVEATENTHYNFDSTGYGGTGYCFSGTQNVPSWIRWMYDTTWPTDSCYVTFRVKFANFSFSGGHENLKFFYPHWDGTNSYVHFAQADSNTVYFSAHDKNGNVLLESQWWDILPGGASFTDGNWHKLEFLIVFSTAEMKYWADGTLMQDRDWADSSWTTAMYYLTFLSSDAEGIQGTWLRQLDDIEVWDGLPRKENKPKTPSNPLIELVPGH